MHAALCNVTCACPPPIAAPASKLLLHFSDFAKANWTHSLWNRANKLWEVPAKVACRPINV